jgi:hypothetical protein
MVVVAIRNEVNKSDKPIVLSFRRRDQMSGDVMWSVLEKVSQSTSRHINYAVHFLSKIIHNILLQRCLLSTVLH